MLSLQIKFAKLIGI